MAEIRFNYGDKFTQTSDSNTGIGSTIPAGKLDVAGNTKAGSLRVSGISTLSSVSGFVNTKLTTNTEDLIVEAGQSGSVSGEVVVSTGQTISVSTGATTGQGGIQSLKVSQTFMPPVGGTVDRPTDVKPGMLYYNRDFKTIEFWDGNFWKQVDNTTRRGRAVFMGGNTPSQVHDIDFVNISSLGNAVYFGNLSTGISQSAGSASETRGLSSGGWSSPTRLDINEYITIASEGNAIDFGNLTQGRSHPGACNSSTRSLVAAGYGPNYRNEIDYVEIATIGNSVDFGDTTLSRDELTGLSSPTRGIFAAGGTPSQQNLIEFVTISSKGNAVKFGELTRKSSYACGGGDGTRGIIIPGNTPSPSGTDPLFIDQITIASEGNATDFGGTAITIGANRGGSGCTKTRMVFGSGANPSINNTLEFIVISSNGNAQDFGDLHLARSAPAGLSDSNGGLGGF